MNFQYEQGFAGTWTRESWKKFNDEIISEFFISQGKSYIEN